MNKIIAYVLLVIAYLGLSKSFSPSEFGINYVLNEKSLSQMIKGQPVSVILADMHSTGFIIKTYYHKYKLIYGFQSYEELIVRTSSQFAKKHKKNIGLSIFRRYEDEREEEYTPVPPGTLFVGDKRFGSWIFDDSGEKLWKFYRVYRNLPVYLGWGSFRPSEKFHQAALYHITQKKTFYGLEKKFGVDGEITRQSFSQFFKRQLPEKVNFKIFFTDYFRKNFYQNGILE